jgi:hypothetical protein
MLIRSLGVKPGDRWFSFGYPLWSKLFLKDSQSGMTSNCLSNLFLFALLCDMCDVKIAGWQARLSGGSGVQPLLSKSIIAAFGSVLYICLVSVGTLNQCLQSGPGLRAICSACCAGLSMFSMFVREDFKLPLLGMRSFTIRFVMVM